MDTLLETTIASVPGTTIRVLDKEMQRAVERVPGAPVSITTVSTTRHQRIRVHVPAFVQWYKSSPDANPTIRPGASTTEEPMLRLNSYLEKAFSTSPHLSPEFGYYSNQGVIELLVPGRHYDLSTWTAIEHLQDTKKVRVLAVRQR